MCRVYTLQPGLEHVLPYLGNASVKERAAKSGGDWENWASFSCCTFLAAQVRLVHRCNAQKLSQKAESLLGQKAGLQ